MQKKPGACEEVPVEGLESGAGVYPTERSPLSSRPTAFTPTWPWRDCAPKPIGRWPRTRAQETLSGGGGEGPPCVLVVEDDALIRMVTVDTLETLGFKVEEAGSATEAVNKLKLGTRIDVALVDMGLPDRNGDVLVGELRELQPKLRIVIASGYSPANLKKRVTEDQLTRFLAKPYDGRQLEAMLKDLGIDPPVPTPP